MSYNFRATSPVEAREGHRLGSGKLGCRRCTGPSMGFMEIGQPKVTLITIVVGQQPIHQGVGGNRAKDQIRPVDSFVLVTVVHQPAGSLTTKSQVQGVVLK